MVRRKLSDAERWQSVGMKRGGMSYRQAAERFNVMQHVNQTWGVKERQGQEGFRKRPQEKIVSLQGSLDNIYSALQTRCEADGLSTGALADGRSRDVLTMQGVMLGDR